MTGVPAVVVVLGTGGAVHATGISRTLLAEVPGWRLELVPNISLGL